MRFRSIRTVLLSLLSLGCADTRAQAVENVLLETYHTQPATKAGDAPLVTYRIYIDLAPGCKLQMVYGNDKHRVKIATTTTFFNDTVNGGIFGDRIPHGRLNTYPLALDSWLTMGAASNQALGIPLHLDNGNSLLGRGAFGNGKGQRRSRIPEQDGLMHADSIPSIVNFRMEPSYLKDIPGSLVLYTDGAWAVLGGVKGPTKENMVLIAQLTTDGTLVYELNLQIGTPEGAVVRYVARNAQGEEVLFPGLLHTLP